MLLRISDWRNFKARLYNSSAEFGEESHEGNFHLLVDSHVATAREVDESQRHTLAIALAGSGQPSIDAFLNANRHEPGFEKLGKAAIAQVLLDYERNAAQQMAVPKEDDWLTYLFGVMLEGIDAPKQFAERNKIGFVTFNYDRFLEMWLLRKIKFSFGLHDSEALAILGLIPIHHVYGQLGPFTGTQITESDTWLDASKCIRTIFDAERDESLLGEVKMLLAQANSICLLGFGFHCENIQLLDLATHLSADKGVLAASRFDITDTEWGRVTRQLPHAQRIRRPGPGCKCLETLRNVPIF